MVGTLYLIPTMLSDSPLRHILPDGNADVIVRLKVFIVENVRTARRFLKQVNKDIVIDDLRFFELNQHTDINQIASYLEPLLQGSDVGIISEAGCPAIADPGADVVALAQQKGIKVVPLVGPSSILLSLMASGFNGQSFAFNGYLPIDKNARTQQLKLLEKRVYAEHQTQIFIETPYRNKQLIEELCKNLQPQTKLCIASDITGANEYIRTQTVAAWKKALPDIGKVPCIFLIYK
ncbi:MAG: SAM-dependent methyltransferase [Paludibacteraceae bacterium]